MTGDVPTSALPRLPLVAACRRTVQPKIVALEAAVAAGSLAKSAQSTTLAEARGHTMLPRAQSIVMARRSGER